MYRTLIQMIKSFLKGEQTDWDLNLGCLAAAYRATPQESTGLTPNAMMLGREVRLPCEVIYSNSAADGEPVSSFGDHVENLTQKLQKAHHIARKHLEVAANRQKCNYNVNVSLQLYQAVDFVWCRNEVWKEKVIPKLQPS